MAQSPLYGGGRRYDYRDRLASSLLAEGSSGAPIQSGWQGAARLAQALMGGYLANKGEEDRQNEQRQYTQGLASAFAPEQVMQPGPDGRAGPTNTAQMVTRQPDPSTIAQRLFATNNPQLAGMAANMQMQEAAARQAREQAANQPFNLRPGERRMGPDGRVLAENPVAERPQAPPAAVAEFQFAQQNGFRGSFMDYQRAQAEARRAPEQPGTGPFAGSGIEAQHFNNLLTLPPTDPRYGVSFNALYGRRTVTQADGTTVEIQPPVPNGIAQPGATPQQAPQQQPAPQGAPMPADPQAPQAAAPSNVTTIQTPGGSTVTRIGSPREKDLSEAQAKANLFGGQMLRAESLLSELKAPSNAAIIAWRNAPEGAVNLGLNENDQAYFNALRLFASGVLRKETGAAFTANELLDVQSRFFPMPGDTPRIAAQKAANRKQAQESIRAEMPGGQFRGIVAPPVYGSQDMQGGGQAAPGDVRTWNPATGKLE